MKRSLTLLLAVSLAVATGQLTQAATASADPVGSDGQLTVMDVHTGRVIYRSSSRTSTMVVLDAATGRILSVENTPSSRGPLPGGEFWLPQPSRNTLDTPAGNGNGFRIQHR
jgi:D-alanyl-D-alanine carboxypeptidase